MTGAWRPLFVFCAGCFWFSCAPARDDLNSLVASFGRDEFIASRGMGADGWAEARRRQILKAYFKNHGLAYAEKQLASAVGSGKYRDTALRVEGKGASRPVKISFALKPAKNGPPDEHFRRAQNSCDKTLFVLLGKIDSYLENAQTLEFLATENCLDLTTQLRLED